MDIIHRSDIAKLRGTVGLVADRIAALIAGRCREFATKLVAYTIIDALVGTDIAMAVGSIVCTITDAIVRTIIDAIIDATIYAVIDTAVRPVVAVTINTVIDAIAHLRDIDLLDVIVRDAVWRHIHFARRQRNPATGRWAGP